MKPRRWTKKTRTQSNRIAPLRLDGPRISTEWFKEPHLVFSGDLTHPDPKIGIPLYGPRSLGTARHKQEVHLGFIGTADAVEHAQGFYDECANGISGDDEHHPFPGCKADRGFRCELRMNSSLIELVTRHESMEVLGIKNPRDRFETMLGLLDKKLELLTQRDHPLDYIVLVLSHELYTKCRVADYSQKGFGKIHRDLRRAFKATAMKFHKPTQILLETTTGLTPSTRKLDHKSVIAWNLFTGLYFKVDGLPWGPTELPSASCFVGVSFFRPLGESSTLRTSVVQAFDENGEGLVLRGHDFHWDEEKQGKSPHLDQELAGRLIETVLERYQEERKQPPQRLVLYKTSRFEPGERAGFEQALASRVNRYDLVSLCPTSNARLIRAGRYPPLRGLSFRIGDVSYLYTTGYLPDQGGYPHGHVPSPLQIADHVGDTSESQLIREILTLTKMNWNSANFCGLFPITVRFSRLVGEILREIPEDRTPQPKYKYYM